jgi:indoleacetate decarboxylase
MIANSCCSPFTPREVLERPSTERSAYLKDRYLREPLVVDVEYIRLLTESHRRTDGMETLERRAENHAFALEHLSPVIHPRDELVGNKTRFIRGAIPYANYAAGPFLREMRKEEQDAQQKHMEQGHGGGIEQSLALAREGNYRLFSGKFLITNEDYESFRDICEYWEDKCMMEQGDRLWKSHFAQADFIEKGWAIGLYTAPHEPCPEGRLVLDYEMALSKGYRQIIAEIDERIASFQPTSIEDSAKLHFWRAAKRSLQGAISYAENYANEAQRQAAAESDPARKARLEQMAEACRRVPAEAPRNFREAMQAFWFTYLLGHIEGSHLGYSPGRLDQLLHPYFENDGTCSYDEAVELFEELFVKMTQIEYVASLSWQGLGHGNLYQNCILGGLDAEGRAADNETSLAILDAQIHMQMTQPTLSVWYDDLLSEKFLRKAVQCVKTGCGYPAFFNQKTYVEHERKTSGLPLKTIRKHAAIGGCTEPTLQGMSYGVVQAGFVNHGKLLDLVMSDGLDPLTQTRLFDPVTPKSYEDIRQSFTDKMHAAIRNWQRYWNYAMLAHRNTVPLVFCSVFVQDCLGRGRCMDDGGATLNQTPTTLSSGMVNVANTLAAIKKLCFDDAVCSYETLRKAVENNWEGEELLRKKALDAPKWGNDDDYVDSIFLELFRDYCVWVRGQDNYLGKPYDPSMLAISTPVPFGKVCAAFADGRKAFEPLADGVTSPFPGTDVHGPTAVIRSSSKVDHTEIRGGLLNLKFHPSALQGDRGARNLLALIKTYFDRPTFHVQFNVVDSRMLRDAQEHPENYRDLVVRVAGFSAYWVEMSKPLQDQVIWRTEHNL